jgi:hypothetical protein
LDGVSAQGLHNAAHLVRPPIRLLKHSFRVISFFRRAWEAIYPTFHTRPMVSHLAFSTDDHILIIPPP